MLSVRTARTSRKLSVMQGAPPGAAPVTSTVEQTCDQRFDFTRDAVCQERIADRTALPGERGALRQGYGGGDAFRPLGERSAYLRQVLAASGRVHGRHDAHAWRAGASPCGAMPVL
jgi:hypothetical protein